MSITTRIQGPILIVTIDRQEAMNSLDAAADSSLRSAWDFLENTQELRAAVLTGAGQKAFSAGADLKAQVPKFRKQALENEKDLVWSPGGGIARGLEITKPVIAAVNGHCLAGGLEIALACDIRICTPNATFGMVEPHLALSPGAGGTQRLPRAIPLSLAFEMLFTGDPIDAETALRVGLVNRILPHAELVVTAVALAERIAEHGPLAIASIKKLVYEGLRNGFDHGMQIEHETFLNLMKTADAAEGYTAFAEKRRPIYYGR